MSKLLGILVCITKLAIASSAVCGTPELVKVLEDREFWYSYQWDKFDESALYKTTTWRLAGMSGRGDVKTSDNYRAAIFINNLPVEAVTIYVDAVTMHANYISMSSYNRLTTDDHKIFLNWCSARFGVPEREEDKKTENLGAVTRTTISSYWAIGNTRILLTTRNNISNGSSSEGFITILSFSKYIKPSAIITNDAPPINTVTSPHPSDDSIPRAITRAQPVVGVVPASLPVSARSSAQAVPARPHSKLSPSSVATTSMMSTDGKNYQPPPYIWESESGATAVANDISDVPEEKRPQFELKR